MPSQQGLERLCRSPPPNSHEMLSVRQNWNSEVAHSMLDYIRSYWIRSDLEYQEDDQPLASY
ncbi:hypothetical protein KXW30_003644 [Aspergillus fumigatus]|nr:hypothetical protein KXX63_003128 [Aspergillus fumigatus]KAH2334553.1 hypothetical protein KXW30_003644 [Aspergillus fumigatus]KAH2494771.1 hypothetical protein KXW70_004068 [Aspergillus fumigatus]